MGRYLYQKPHPIHEVDTVLMNAIRTDTGKTHWSPVMCYDRCLPGMSDGDYASMSSNSLSAACPALSRAKGNLKWGRESDAREIWLTQMTLLVVAKSSE